MTIAQVLHVSAKIVWQLGRNDGSGVFKSCMELRVVSDSDDLIHGWGIDFQLGYCAQGDRKQKVGVVDAEYIVHLGVPSLGGSN
ncbi:hypothetical protein M8C21_004478, partial [Ambrosia artemisiifolia]